MEEKEYKTFKEFYPFYLEQHKKTGTRVTHFIGTTLFLLLLLYAMLVQQTQFILAGVASAYLFAWIGHFFIEHNKPATFKYPWMSLKGDFKLYFEILIGKQKLKGE